MNHSKRRLFRCVCAALALTFAVSACGGQTNFESLTAEDPIAELTEGIAVSANPASLPDDFGVQLEAIAGEAFLNGEAGEAWEAPLAALPANLRLHSDLFQIETKGTLPEQLFLSVATPSTAEPFAFDLYAWNGTAWEFLPAQARGGQLVAAVSQPPAAVALFQVATLPPLAYLAVEPGQALSQPAAEAANGVLLGGVVVQPDGSLSGQVPGVPQEGGYAIYPVVRGSASGEADPALLAGVLGDDAVRARHLQTLVAFVLGGGYDGLVLDYAGLTAELSPVFAQFVHDLAAQFHAEDKSLLVAVEPATQAGGAFNTGGYDWRVLGAAADGLLVPVADDPAAYGSGYADALLAWAVGEVPRGRLRLLTSALHVEHAAGQFALLDQQAALAPLGLASLEGEAEAVHAGDPITVKLSGEAQSLTYDAQAFAASYAYTDGNGQSRIVWLTSAATLRQRLTLAEKYRLGGVAVADLMAAGAPGELLNAVTQYKAAVAAAAQAEAGVLWTVKNGDAILALATAQPDEPYVYVPPSAGQYELSASLQHGATAGLGAVAVQVAEITPTPTETATPTATAVIKTGGGSGTGSNSGQATATPAPTQPPSDGGGVFVPPPPIGAGTFELGGQVPGFIGHPAQMQQAGMKWVKFQVRGGGADLVAAGHAAGFKVLLSVIGDKGRVTDPAYWDEYAGWVAGLAAAGADAIEVWNEPNIDHEWPEGQISAATYTQLLAKAYTAIKGANGGTLVISGGPAPTGAEGAFPGKVVNDDRFVREMAVAGAANYMDCIGIHYNTGTTSPNATTGSALSGYHYSYYYWSMVDTYWNAFGGSRPLCFTELGYLSPEGFDSLSSHFGWAAGTSVAEHAQWLAEAASLSGNSGKVRLMIVWNVDFTTYGNDPQAGYAMIRPDGSCPACAALDAVMP